VAPTGPPDDFDDQPTRHVNIGRQQPPGRPEPIPTPTDQHAPFGSLDPFDEETEPIEWYRRPVVLIAWGISVLVLIALIVYGIIQLVGDQGTISTPNSSTTTTTTTSTSPPTTTTTTTTTTATTTPTTSAAPPPTQQPTYTQQQPTHRRHWPSWLPSTLPGFS
jgi:hypothetical protein